MADKQQIEYLGTVEPDKDAQPEVHVHSDYENLTGNPVPDNAVPLAIDNSQYSDDGSKQAKPEVQTKDSGSKS